MNLNSIPFVLCVLDGRFYSKLNYITSKYKACLFYALLLFALILSWTFEYVTGNSFVAFFCPSLECPVFLRAKTVKELIGTLGFSVGLIAVVYSFWDKRILGLRYRDLVKFKFHSYHLCAIAHIISVACCIISATAETSESALISLTAVIYGFVYQAVVVYWTVWDSRKCATTANKMYRELVSETLEKKNSASNEELYKYLRKLSDTMPQPADRQYSAQLECFARTFVAYVVSENKLPEQNDQNAQKLLSRITEIWASVFLAPGPYDTTKDHVSFAVAVFNYMVLIGQADSNCSNYTEQDMLWAWNQICSGYLVCRLNQMQSKLSEEEIHDKLYREVAKMLTVLPNGKYTQYIKDALTSLLVVIMLTSFTAHAISFNPRVIEMYTEHKLKAPKAPDYEYVELWKKRNKYWSILCTHLRFTITVNVNLSKNILKYTQKI